MQEKNKVDYAVGSTGEQMVAQWLEQQGYTIVCRNYRKRYGEIDVIASNKSVLCFVEVKTRYSPTFSMSSLIVPSKQQKIIMTARDFIAHYPHKNMIYRFDVALVQPDRHADPIVYICNAFTSENTQEGYL